MNDLPANSSRAARMLQKLTRRSHSRTGLWKSHLATFGATSAFLVFLNLITGGSTPWSAIVMSAWSIPLGVHALLKRRREKLKTSLEESTKPPAPGSALSGTTTIPDEIYRPFRKRHRSTTAFQLQTTIAGTTSALLAVINLITGGALWFPIPVASMAFALGVWAILRKPRQQKLRRQIEEARTARPKIVAKEAAPSHPQLEEAYHLREQIAVQLEDDGSTHGSFLSTVDQMIAEIARLTRLDTVYQEANAHTDPAALKRDRERIVTRIAELPTDLSNDQASTELLQKYEQSLVPIEREIETISRLEEQHEMLRLRLRSAVSSLRHVLLDLVRMQGDATLQELDSQSEELGESLSDLRESYNELAEMLNNAQ